MDTSNIDLEFIGSQKLVPKLKELAQIPNHHKTVYSIKVDSDSETSAASEGSSTCRCLEKCENCPDEESETIQKTTITRSMPKHIKRSIDTLNTIKERVLNSDKLDDEFSHFGKNIASQLRQLPITDALNLQLQFLEMLRDKREAVHAAKLDKSSSSSYTTEYTFEIHNTISKSGPPEESPINTDVEQT